jgi:RNA polymerase sigma factor (sigma-70 family)
MATKTRNADLLREVRTLFSFGVRAHSSDGQLLDRFLNGGQVDAESAFTILVERHGAMVWHVCRQVLGDSHDAHDAFQATFLVLLSRAKSIRKRDSLASWLFGVALKVARRARYAVIVRRFHERKAAELAEAEASAPDRYSECTAALYAELARLPERYREPIVLCHLEGLSTAAAAARLGCAQGTILSRLARGRERLRRRLAQSGSAALAIMPAPPVAPDLPVTIVRSTVDCALRSGFGRTTAAVMVTPAVAVLTENTLRTLLITRTSLAAGLLLTATAAVLLALPAMRQVPAATSQAAARPKDNQGKQEAPRSSERTRVLSAGFEEALYRILKRDREFNDPNWAFLIKVRDVQERTLIDATIKHRVKGKINEYDAIFLAERAVLRVDLDAKIVRAVLEEAAMQRLNRDADVFLKNNNVLEMPIPIVHALAFAPDGKTLIYYDSDGVYEIKAQIGKLVRTMNPSTPIPVQKARE